MYSNEVDRELQLGQIAPRYPNADYLRYCMSLSYNKAPSASRHRKFVNIIMSSIVTSDLTISAEVAEKTASLADSGYKLFCLIQILYAHIMWRQNQGILGMDQTIKHHAWLDMLPLGKLTLAIDKVFVHPAHVTLCHDLDIISFLYHGDFIESTIPYYRMFNSGNSNMSDPIIARKPYVNDEDMSAICQEYQNAMYVINMNVIELFGKVSEPNFGSSLDTAQMLGRLIRTGASHVTHYDIHMGEVRVMDGPHDYLDTSKIAVKASTEPVSKKMRELSRKIPKLAELRTKAAAKSRKLPSVPGHDPQKPWKSNRTKR